MKLIKIQASQVSRPEGTPPSETTTLSSLAARVKELKANRFFQAPSENEATLNKLFNDLTHLVVLQEHPIVDELDPEVEQSFASNALKTARKITMSQSTEPFETDLSPEQRAEVHSFIPEGAR